MHNTMTVHIAVYIYKILPGSGLFLVIEDRLSPKENIEKIAG